MFTILLHSSKTMRSVEGSLASYQSPQLLEKANMLAAYLSNLTLDDVQKVMHLSLTKASQTQKLLQEWTSNPSKQSVAIDSFKGDIYSGLQVQALSATDREFANQHLLILSGLYGGLRALDSIYPYRLEMGYKLPDKHFRNLYTYWGDQIATLIPEQTTVINLSAVEYTKSLLPLLQKNTIITPKFLTMSSKTNEPMFVTVHAKIARGAFAHWLIIRRSCEELSAFNELGYCYDAQLSSLQQPVFVCKNFGGLGLSVRLS